MFDDDGTPQMNTLLCDLAREREQRTGFNVTSVAEPSVDVSATLSAKRPVDLCDPNNNRRPKRARSKIRGHEAAVRTTNLAKQPIDLCDSDSDELPGRFRSGFGRAVDQEATGSATLAAEQPIDLCDSDDDDELPEGSGSDFGRAADQGAAERNLSERLAREQQELVPFAASGIMGYDPQRINKSFARGSGRVRGALSGRARLGSCGFSQKQLVFYPQEMKGKDKHAYYAERFGAVELDGLFYGIPGEATFESWRSLAEKHSGRPDAYELVPKCNKFFTHTKRLIVDADFRERWSHFMTKCAVLGGFCPAILMQFSGSGKQCFKRSDETHARLVAFAALVSEGAHRADGSAFDPFFVLEFRHASWYTEEVYMLIEAHPRLTMAQIHHAGCPEKFGQLEEGWHPSHPIASRLWANKLCYIRPHGTIGFTQGDYGRAAMAELGQRMRAFLAGNPSANALVFFNNDAAILLLQQLQPSSCVCDGYALAQALSEE